MKKVYTVENRMLAGYVQGILESHHIDCFLKNDGLVGVAGEVPPHECWPEVWVQDDRDVELARRLIHDLLEETGTADAWLCPNCRETIEGQFSHCWNCGAEAPDPA